MSQSKKKRKGVRVQWKIFAFLFLIVMFILVILWTFQVLFINSFYQHVKTEELKDATDEVIVNLEKVDRKDVFDRIIMQNDINIRIINTADFESIYSGGNGFFSVTHDIGFLEIMKIYDLAKANGGEVTQYYTYDKNKSRGMNSTAKSPVHQDNLLQGTAPEEDLGEEDDSRNKIGVHFYKSKPPAMFFRSPRYVDDFLYAKITCLSDGTELLIISDVQVTPLDSTVQILKIQLISTTIISLVLSLILSYFISRYIAKPIEELNVSAKELAKGKFDTHFKGKGYREIEQLSDTLNYTASELSKVDRFRTELLANVSHDLRTPLTMIEGYAEMMRDIPGENTPENVQVIIDETNRLTDFVNNILDLSKLQSAIDSYTPEKANITLMLSEITESYRNLLKQDGYCFDMMAEEEAYISCDENKISQALHNLLDNAVNHTGEDKHVSVAQKISGNIVRIEITDTGKGIPEEELPYIWDRYYRAKSSHRRAVVGSGIGLSIVKSIFEMHRLKYGVESVENTGTTFWVEFPLYNENAEKENSHKNRKHKEKGKEE